MAKPRLTAELLQALHDAVMRHAPAATFTGYQFSAIELQLINDDLDTCGVEVDVRPVRVELEGPVDLEDINTTIQNGVNELVAAIRDVAEATTLVGLTTPSNGEPLSPGKASSGALKVYAALHNKPEVLDALLPLLKDAFKRHEEKEERRARMKEAMQEAVPR